MTHSLANKVVFHHSVICMTGCKLLFFGNNLKQKFLSSLVKLIVKSPENRMFSAFSMFFAHYQALGEI